MSVLLAIHTSTPTLALGLYSLSVPGAEEKANTWHLDRRMGGELHQYLSEIMTVDDWPDISAVAVIIGPGSFTSCRMGVTVARTLGQSLDLPVFGISALEAIAYNALTLPENIQTSTLPQEIGVFIDAKRGEYCAGIYQLDNDRVTTLVPERLFTTSDWEQLTSDRKISAVDADKDENTLPALKAMAMITAQRYQAGDRPHWSEVLPYYSRQPPIHKGVSQAIAQGIQTHKKR